MTQLGYFDDNGDGLAEVHHVGIWDSSGTLQMTDAVINGDPLIGEFRYGSTLSGNNVLLANTTYVIGGSTGLVDAYAFNPLAVSFDPAISYVGSNYVGDGGFTLTFPDLDGGSAIGYFGPNFRYDAVPEPTTVFALGGGAIALLIRRRKNG